MPRNVVLQDEAGVAVQAIAVIQRVHQARIVAQDGFGEVRIAATMARDWLIGHPRKGLSLYLSPCRVFVASQAELYPFNSGKIGVRSSGFIESHFLFAFVEMPQMDGRII